MLNERNGANIEDHAAACITKTDTFDLVSTQDGREILDHKTTTPP
jgi:hypothetical protein